MAARDEIIAFTTIVDMGTFSAAAEKLNITTAGVSRRIKTLEERLGIRLLNRTTRTATLTEAGKIYNERVRELMSSFDSVEKELRSMSDSAVGELKIAVPMTFAAMALSNYFPKFMREYPEISLRVVSDDRMADIVGEGFDIALRIATPHTSSLEATKLAPVSKSIVASPAYLKQHGVPKSIADLEHHNCLIYSLSTTSKEGWLLTDGKQSKHIDVKGNFFANNGRILLNAAKDGLGLALLPEFIYQKAVDAGELVRVLPQYGVDNTWLYALYPSTKMMPPKVKVFLTFLEKHMVDCVTGEVPK